MAERSRPFEIDELEAFVAIADLGGFTRAAERLGRTQSTVSLQIQRLERRLGERVFEREGGGRAGEPRLTSQGEILLGYARQILRLCEEAGTRLAEHEVEGLVRLGTPEDFATVHLPEILARFARTHPRIALEVSCDFTVNLLEAHARGLYDLVLIKRDPQGPAGGVGVWREELVWAASPLLEVASEARLPLVLAPAPDVYRKRALASLDAAGLAWRVVYTSPSLAGLQAAVKAGLGVTVLPREMVPEGFCILTPQQGLPALTDTEIVLYRARGGVSEAAERLAAHIVHSLESASGAPHGRGASSAAAAVTVARVLHRE